MCALALVNRITLGLPLARYFLCLVTNPNPNPNPNANPNPGPHQVMGEPPTELPELQSELAEEGPSPSP